MKRAPTQPSLSAGSRVARVPDASSPSVIVVLSLLILPAWMMGGLTTLWGGADGHHLGPSYSSSSSSSSSPLRVPDVAMLYPENEDKDEAASNIHPSNQMIEVDNLCGPICECSDLPPTCPEGVPLVQDGCGCCLICARQQGDACDRVQVCDMQRQLECVRHHLSRTTGICKVKRGQGCHVGGHDFKDGETFKLDCRTQCTCQNGTYGCVSLCPNEKIRPSSSCRHPQLVPIEGACCREWQCESSPWHKDTKNCSRHTSDWSPCSVSCGVGQSFRITNDNPDCELRNETRLCRLRICYSESSVDNDTKGGRVRRKHRCRATERSDNPVRLVDSKDCHSVRLYQPKFCGHCVDQQCCHPYLTTTLKVPFRCPPGGDAENNVPEIVSRDYMWIVKCSCSDDC